MKPDWDKLMKQWNQGARVKTTLIADVDCTAEGKPLCERVGVSGFPAIKWGDASNLEDYKGDRTYDKLKKFAKENLKPMCSPTNIELCDAAKKKEIGKFEAMSDKELEDMIEENKSKMKTAEDYFKEAVEKLQETHQQLTKDKENTIAEVKKSGLGLMQAVLANSKKTGGKSEL